VYQKNKREREKLVYRAELTNTFIRHANKPIKQNEIRETIHRWYKYILCPISKGNIHSILLKQNTSRLIDDNRRELLLT